jgi:hypothetical protein
LIDVDKWWSLHVVHFTGHGLASIWTTEESLNQLDKILITPVQIRLSAGELPFTTQATPQSIIREWDYQRQRALLQQKISLLAALRMRANQDAVQLVENYRQGLDLYLQRRGKSDNSARKAELSPGAKIIVNETTKRLDALDFQRESLRRKTNPPPAQLTTSR